MQVVSAIALVKQKEEEKNMKGITCNSLNIVLSCSSFLDIFKISFRFEVTMYQYNAITCSFTEKHQYDSRTYFAFET